MRADSRHASQVQNDDGVIDFKRRGDPRPHVARVAEPMRQHNRGAMTAHPYVQRRAVSGDVGAPEVLRNIGRREEPVY
jgi:hypothetical protein